MGGCFCSSRKHPLHGTPLYYYCPPIMQEHESLTSHDSATTVLTRRFLVDLNLDTSTPDTYQSPPAPVPYDMILRCPRSSNAESLREIVSPGGFENLSGANLKKSDCRTDTCPASPKELEVEILKSNELNVSAVEEDGCPTCLEDFDAENPKIITKCNHHFHLSCILEWMERSDTCPICDQLGMGSALETLCGQVFGAGQLDMLGIYMQRSWIILSGACLFILPLYIYATPILKLLGQRDDIARLAGEFSVQVIPQMFSLAINFPTQKFLQAQSKVGILAWIGLVALVAHIGMLFLFVNVFGWGTAGAATAYDVSAWLLALGQVGYIVGWCKQDGWKGLSWLALEELWSFLKLSLASAVMICLEIWYFMSIIVLTGHLADPVIAVGSLSICMNINGWEGMLFIGINAAISVRVSNELGSKHPRAAKYSVFVTVAESLLIGILGMVIITTTRNHFPVIFTDSKQMQKAVAHLAYLLAITMVLNSVQPVISGVAVGGGWQLLVAFINLFCYYLVGLPLGFFLGYKTSLGVEGIWIGMICGTLLQTLILLFITWKTNWNEEVAQASERVRRWSTVQEQESDPL